MKPLDHVIASRAKGLATSAESDGYLSAGAEATRDTALFLAMVWAILIHLPLNASQISLILAIAGLGWSGWKLGRNAWLAWMRLEKLHRLLADERWEIEHHRQQEREELRVLYEAKGFRGKLLEEVLDVLMADGDRLLRVMIEEELGLSLEVHEHPLQQGLGAAAGALLSVSWCLFCVWLWPAYGLLPGGAVAVSAAAALLAYLEGNLLIPAVVWNLGIATLAFSCTYFLLDWAQLLR